MNSIDGFLIAQCNLGDTNAVAVLAADGMLHYWVGHVVGEDDDRAFVWDPNQSPGVVQVNAVMAMTFFDEDGQLTQRGVKAFGIWLEIRQGAA